MTALPVSWEVEGEPPTLPRRMVSAASVALCACGWKAVFCHVTYSRRQADQLAGTALEGHQCRTA